MGEPPFRPERRGLEALSASLAEEYGPQQWWPAETRLEIVIGAVLTQNTAWTNVERAIGNLRAAGVLDLHGLLALAPDELAEMLRPAGYFNLKARRLSNLLRAISARGGLETMARTATGELRDALLAVNGVGPETADDILLYAFARPVFVVDAYTRRLFSRLGLAGGGEGYEVLRQGVEKAVPGAVSWYQEFHALVVAHGKQRCRPRPLCPGCPLLEGCRHGAANA